MRFASKSLMRQCMQLESSRAGKKMARPVALTWKLVSNTERTQMKRESRDIFTDTHKTNTNVDFVNAAN